MSLPVIGKGTDAALLLAFRDRLRSKVIGFSEQNCFITDVEVPPDSMLPTVSDIVGTVSLTNGEFDYASFAGGGFSDMLQRGLIGVTALRRVMLDKPPSLDQAITDDKQGVLANYKGQILKAILYDNGLPWFPIYKSKCMLVDQLSPNRTVGPYISASGNWLAMTQYFNYAFHWDIGP